MTDTALPATKPVPVKLVRTRPEPDPSIPYYLIFASGETQQSVASAEWTASIGARPFAPVTVAYMLVARRYGLPVMVEDFMGDRQALRRVSVTAPAPAVSAL